MARSTTKRSTPKLSEVARHLVLPSGIVSTGWPAVEATVAQWGESFDRWQAGLGRVILGKRADGYYATTVGGITISIPRQVAKTFIVSRIVFALCILFPGLTVVWTAHRTRTSDETFRKLSGLARRKKVAPFIAQVRSANGQQEIAFRNGSRILFGAREQGFGRGFDEVDVLVFDEAQILTEKALEDMVAATNQSRHPHGALVFYMGTPPRPTDPGEAFTKRRREALEVARRRELGEVVDFDALYVETSADPRVGRPADPSRGLPAGPSLDDRRQWREANPSFPSRTPLVSMLRLRSQLPTDDAWRREGLGVWDEFDGPQPVIQRGDWLARQAAPPAEGRVSFAVKFAVDGSSIVLAAAKRPDEGPVFVEVVERVPASRGTAGLVEWLAERWRRTACIIVDGRAGADAFVLDLKRAGVPERMIVQPTSAVAAAAYAGLVEAVRRKSVVHGGQPGLVESVAASGRRPIGQQGGWGFAPITPDGDETPTEAVALALHAAMTTKRRPGHKQRAVVM